MNALFFVIVRPIDACFAAGLRMLMTFMTKISVYVYSAYVYYYDYRGGLGL